MVRKYKILSFFSLSLLASFSFASHAPTTHSHVIVAPHCLLQHVKTDYQTLSSSSSLALIEVNNTGISQLIDAKNKTHATPCGGFIDVTEAWKNAQTVVSKKITAKTFLQNYLTPKKSLQTSKQTYEIKHEKEVNDALKHINPQDIWADLTQLTSFPDRYSQSENGVKAAEWIKTQVETIAKNNGHDDVTVYYVQTGNYKQPSVVAKLGNGDGPGIVIGGHMDTLSSSWESKPGADDDGSGSVTVLGVARTILSSGMHFKKPIYFIWYAAEEIGLVGSSYVVQDFKNKNIPVDAVLQFDMTGYAYKNDPTMWLITDNVNPDLTNYIEELIKTYVKQPIGRTQCGYACSDHASWHQEGFTAAFPFEAKFGQDDPYIHTARDTMDVLSLDHITHYAELGTAFAVELAEPTA